MLIKRVKNYNKLPRFHTNAVFPYPSIHTLFHSFIRLHSSIPDPVILCCTVELVPPCLLVDLLARVL